MRAKTARSWLALMVGRVLHVGGYAFGDVYRHVNAQPLQYLEQLAPLHRLAAALDLAQKIFANANAAGGIVLADFLCLAAGAHHLADGGRTVDGYLHHQSSRL